MTGRWVLSVGQLNEYVRRQLAGDPMLRNVSVQGEISGYKRHYSGHLYFSIKDENARVQCVMFRQNAMGLPFEPQDGQKVVVTGAASLYAQTGSFQLYVEKMERAGVGELYLQFEELKERLTREGLFDPARKKMLPRFPKTIGVVTSRSGAALRDILRVSTRRNPFIQIIVCPAQVQGEGAAQEIAEAIARLNRDGRCDVLLVGRGGGSIEDLWAFNEEVVARAIASSEIPVISCVGHETDFTIADFAADVRAATPSMAAEMAVPQMNQIRQELSGMEKRMVQAQKRMIALAQSRLDRLALRMSGPAQMLLAPRREKTARLANRLDNAMTLRINREKAHLAQIERTLTALNPGQVLLRGYAFVTDEVGAAVSAKTLKPGDGINIRLKDGTVDARVDRAGEDI